METAVAAAEAARPESGAAFNRRAFGLGAAALAITAALPRPSLAAGMTRTFKVVRDGEDIGRQSATAIQTPDGLAVQIRILLEVRRLGIRFYVYEQENDELWRDGKLVKLSGKTNNDGKRSYCRIEPKGGQLEIDGSANSGLVSADAVPTSYWNYANLQKRPWFNSENGNILALNFAKAREGALERWDITGDVALSLFYDAQQEWRSVRFTDKRGVAINYQQIQAGPSFRAMV